MRFSKLILALAVLATLLPGCATDTAGLGRTIDDPVVDAGSPDAPGDVYQPTPSDCDRAHREAIKRCEILFQPGDCYEVAQANYQACLGAATTPE